MKRTILFMSLALAAATLFAKEIKTVVFTMQPEMECANCENKIKGNLRFERGVKDIATDIENQEVTITYDADKTSPESFVKAFGKMGYRVEEVKKQECMKKACGKKDADCCKAKKDAVCTGKKEGCCTEKK